MSRVSRLLRSVEGGFSFWCPGCDVAHVVWTGDGPGPRWDYNGNPEAPTFSPSIKLTGHTWTPPVTTENMDEWRRAPWKQTQVEKICHSLVRDGRIEFCSDSTHALVGQTVDLPDFES